MRCPSAENCPHYKRFVKDEEISLQEGDVILEPLNREQSPQTQEPR